MGRPTLVEDVPLDAEFVADALAAARDARLLDDVRARAGTRTAFRSAPIDEAIRRLRAVVVRADAQQGAVASTPAAWVTPTEYGRIHDRHPETVRRWIRQGRFTAGETRNDNTGRTLVRLDAEPPRDRRTNHEPHPGTVRQAERPRRRPHGRRPPNRRD